MSKISSRQRLEFFQKGNKRRATRSESTIWSYLNQSKTGYHCIRQYIIGNSLADFAFPSINLVVEIDGGYHEDEEQKRKDERRDAFMNGLGWKVIRFKNEQVDKAARSVFDAIVEECDILAELKGVKPRYQSGRSPCGRKA